MDGVLLFVRHAMPLASDTTPSKKWALTAGGLLAARQLRAQLPTGSHLVASRERKAWETIGGSDTDVERDARFNEVTRTDEPWGGDFLRLRRLYVEGAKHPGWESHGDVAARFHDGVVAVEDRCRDRPIVIGTHGMVLTVWLVSIGALPRTDAAEFWTSLRFPDCIEVDHAHGVWRRYC